MELKQYFDILKRRAAIIVIVTATALLAVSLAGLIIPPVYTTSTTLRVLLDIGVTDFNYRDDYSERLLNTYREVVLSGTFLENAKAQIPATPDGIDITKPEHFRDMIEVNTIAKTELITISVTASDPVFARDAANTLANQLAEYPKNLYVGSGKSTQQIIEEQLKSMQADLDQSRAQLNAMIAANGPTTTIEDLRSQISFKEDAYNMVLERLELARLNESLRANSISILSVAALPLEPSNGIGLTQIALSIILGLMGGVVVMLIIENIDTRIYGPQQLEYLTNLPVFGVAPRGIVPPGRFEQLDSPPDEQEIKEAYRVLIPNMKILARHDDTLRSILITSALPDEGKSMVAVNLSQAVAEQGRPTVLVETDLRHSGLAEVFSMPGEFGLSDLLNAAFLSTEMILPTLQTNLFMVCGGKRVTNPTTLLASSAMDNFLGHLYKNNQFIVLDSTAVLGMADALVLASRVDGVVLVIGQEKSNREQVFDAIRQLQAARAHLLGIIFVSKEKSNWRWRKQRSLPRLEHK
jgi:capsular exopolysaccharide synthesis family protein